MQQFSSRITANDQIADGYYELELTWTGDTPLPGQFLTVRLGDSTDPLLRRPFAFSAFIDGQQTAESNPRVRVIYERRGKATRALASLLPGDSVDVLGPLGRSFPEPTPDRLGVLVAGGIGIGPIVFLAQAFESTALEGVCIIGGKTADRIPMSTLDSLGMRILITTEDGSAGIHGNALDGIERCCGNTSEPVDFYTCGPRGMMSAVAAYASERHGDCWVSMEQVMACGVGACMGCAIPIRGTERYARVCTEGPVFHANEIVW
jgi:dihydroorotate dehydrogenase electron transfer subunit